MTKKLSKLYKMSKRIKINDDNKVVIMSDCHRGNGSINDNFIKNKYIYEYALKYYFDNQFFYIELGDGDEMWEVKKYQEIIQHHLAVFKILKNFYDKRRLFMIYGNHDIEKKQFSEVSESLILDYKGYEIFLLHGHQVDFLNSTLWRLSRFLVRNIWKRLERLGFNDPTSAAKNNRVKNKVEKKLSDWSIFYNKIIIAGHTHRPIFPQIGQSLYFNDGSCIHPDGITCLEIEKGSIVLVKWIYHLNEQNEISAKRNILVKKESIINFYK